ncbi:MAG: hypothetical protein K0R46_2382 [Herbinix sp.]|jgi:hypothetical protein|nr:hypothetical protein [Herbinix sp.]
MVITMNYEVKDDRVKHQEEFAPAMDLLCSQGR